MANVDMLSITVRGKGGHGALPHMAVDPVVLAARLIIDLQTLVSRENNPTDPLVVTVGSIHGGTKANIIPDEVKLQLTVRTTRDATRKRVLERIASMARAAAEGAGAPEPVLRIHPGAFTPAVLNDEKLTDETVAVFKKALGADHVHRRPPLMGGEDFALYGRKGVPSFLFFLGTQPPERLADSGPGQTLPCLHSPRFCPVTEPTLKTGVTSMSVAVLNLLSRKAQKVGHPDLVVLFLQAGVPDAERIEQHQDDQPQQIDDGQGDAVAVGQFCVEVADAPMPYLCEAPSPSASAWMRYRWRT